jgi:hypothetical protein
MRNDAPLFVAAIASIAGFALAGWIVARRVRAWSRMVEATAAGADALARLASAAERMVAVLERTTLSVAPNPPAEHPAASLAAGPRSAALAEFRITLKQEDWAQAESQIASFASTNPDDPVVVQLRDELKAAREAAALSLQARLEAAREANDTQRVLEIRENLAAVLDPEQLAPLDRPLARWFLDLIQKRLRQGAISVDVVVLATRVAAALDTTVEGASLRAALPTLRRSVGLCARCGNPYTGIADACPACLPGGAFAPSVDSGGAMTETIVPEPE